MIIANEWYIAMLFKRFYGALHTVIFVGLMSLAAFPTFADYWAPKLDIEFGLGTNLSQSKQRVAQLAVAYELSQEWVVLSSYMYEFVSAPHLTESDSAQRASLGARYQLDFLQIRPWFGLQLGLSNEHSVEPVLGASIGLSYLFLEDWYLSLWGMGLLGSLSEARTKNQNLYRMYGLVSVSYSFTLAESFDEL